MTTSPPPDLLHQRAPGQIFLTGWGPEEDGYRFEAELPLDHPRYCDTSTPHHDLLVVAETVSQVGMVSTINLLGVPADSAFFMRRLAAKLAPLENNLRAKGSQRLRLSTSEGAASVKFRPDGSSSGAHMSTRNSLAERPSGSAQVQAFWMPPERYKQFRSRLRVRHQPCDPVPAGLQAETMTGREETGNSVLSVLEPRGDRRYASHLLLDINDPTFFEPALDHVSGFLLCEAAKQAATAAACRELDLLPSELVVDGAEFSFIAFAELDDVTDCAVEVLDEGEVGVEFSQSGRTVCRADLTVQRL
jgi:hypothetical protein